MSLRFFTPSVLDGVFVGWPPPVLDPAGPYAGSITLLTWVLLAIAAGVVILVVGALWVAFRGSDRMRARLGGTKVIWGAGILLPIVLGIVWAGNGSCQVNTALPQPIRK